MRRPGEVLSRAAPARARVGLRLREPLQRRRRLRAAAAGARSTSRSASRSRPCAARATGCVPRGEPAADPAARDRGVRAWRWRSCSPALGLFLYLRLGSHLSIALDRELRAAGAGSLAALVRAIRAPRSRRQRAASSSTARATRSCSTPDGRVLDATRAARRTPLLDAAAARRSARGPIYATARPSPGSTSRRGCSRRRSAAAATGARRRRDDAGPRRDARRASATSC